MVRSALQRDSVLLTVAWILVRLVCVIAGVKLANVIYRSPTADGDPTFFSYWRKNARDAIYAVGALALMYYIVAGGTFTIAGAGFLAATAVLLLFVTGETVLAHREETYDAIESLPGPFVVKVVTGIGAFLVAVCVCLYYVVYALRSEW